MQTKTEIKKVVAIAFLNLLIFSSIIIYFFINPAKMPSVSNLSLIAAIVCFCSLVLCIKITIGLFKELKTMRSHLMENIKMLKSIIIYHEKRIDFLVNEMKEAIKINALTPHRVKSEYIYKISHNKRQVKHYTEILKSCETELKHISFKPNFLNFKPFFGLFLIGLSIIPQLKFIS